MQIDLFSSTGAKKGTLELPSFMFEAPVRNGLMHRALVMQQSNRRRPVAHVQTRGETKGSTRKIYAQKGTGRARMGPVRSPVRRGGGHVFGPRHDRNSVQAMPRMQRRAALFSCLSHQAKEGKIIALESFDGTGTTKNFLELFKKLPVQHGRRILFVMPEKITMLERGSRNVPGVKTLLASYLNPEDVLTAYTIVFLKEAIAVAEEVFGGRREGGDIREKREAGEESEEKTTKSTKKKAASSASSKPSKTSTNSSSS